MSARCSLVVNGKSVRISTGDTPFEAALAEGLIAPAQGLQGGGPFGQGLGPAPRRSQTRSHRPEPAKLPLPRGPFPAGPALSPQEPPAIAPTTRTGVLSEVTELGPRVLEAVVSVTRRLAFEPGHQVTMTVPGFAPVTASPTLRMDGSAELNEFVFHLALDPDRPSLAASLRDGIALGTPIKLKGPVGRAHYRPGGGRLVLVGAETGFAPIWAIARAARYVEPAREVALLVGARDPLDLYMRPALDWLRATGVARIVVVADRSRQRAPDVRPGPLTAYLPALRATDCVHVAGDASTVGAVQVLSAAAGARCYPILLPPA